MPTGEGRHKKSMTVTGTAAEKAMFQRAAEMSGLSFNMWARNVLLFAARQRLQGLLNDAEPTYSPERLGLVVEDEEASVAGE